MIIVTGYVVHNEIFSSQAKANSISTNTKDPATDRPLTLHTTPQTASTNDLVYHDYKSAIPLTTKDTLITTNLDLNLTQNQTAILYAIEVKSNTYYKITAYTPNQSLHYTPGQDGMYDIVAVTEDKTQILLNDSVDFSISTSEH